jgi:hypothetical protein
MNPGATSLESEWSRKKVIAVPAGRRSGKTERGKRNTIIRGIQTWLNPKYAPMDQNYFLTAPTYGQAKKIFWRDLKKFLSGPFFTKDVRDVSESDLRVTLYHPKNRDRTVNWWVFGMDKPERMEGIDWDGLRCPRGEKPLL